MQYDATLVDCGASKLKSRRLGTSRKTIKDLHSILAHPNRWTLVSNGSPRPAAPDQGNIIFGSDDPADHKPSRVLRICQRLGLKPEAPWPCLRKPISSLLLFYGNGSPGRAMMWPFMCNCSAGHYVFSC